MKVLITSTLVLVVGVALSGCSSVNPYRRVHLTTNLSPDVLRRYEREYREGVTGPESTGTVRLEHSNWWLPGLLLYFRHASVDRMPGPAGPVYHIMEAHGYGTLCILLNTSAMSTYDAAGRRLSGETMTGIFGGHLDMIHSRDSQLADGQTERVVAMHLVHHLLNIHKMEGHTYISLLTVPNPIASETGAAHTSHSTVSDRVPAHGAAAETQSHSHH